MIRDGIYELSDFFQAKEDIEKVVNDVWVIKEHCLMVVLHRGDLTGQVYGSGYNGLEEAGKLLAEFERKVNDYMSAKQQLSECLPEKEYELFTNTHDSIKFKRERITKYFEEIQSYLTGSHEIYIEYPAPKPPQDSALHNVVMLAAYASLAFTIYHLIFG